MRWPLRYQILLPMTVVMLGTLIGVSLLNAYLSARNTKSQIHQQLQNVASTLSQANFPLTDAVLQQTRGLSGAEFVVSEKSGKVISSSRKELTPPALPQSPQSGERLVLDEIVQVGHQPYFYAVTRLSRQSHIDNSALLHIFYPEESYRAALRNAILPPLLVGGVSLVLVALLAMIIAARVTRPLDRLRNQVDQIAHGEFQPVDLPRRNDEILDLGQSVNQMAEMLAGYEDEVRRNERLRILGQLSGSMAHQLRNAATGCRMALDLHRRECPAEENQETLAVALRQLSLMERYLKHFFSRGNGPPKPHTQVDLISVVDDVLALVRPGAEHVGVEVKFDPAKRPLCIDGDADALEQLVINLLQNAIEAVSGLGKTGTHRSESDYVSIQIKQAESGSVTLEVQDSGPGPVSEVRESMFEPLVTGKVDGTGLGLSLAQEIAKQHRSEIRWERRDGMTCFSLELSNFDTKLPSNQEAADVEVIGR